MTRSYTYLKYSIVFQELGKFMGRVDIRYKVDFTLLGVQQEGQRGVEGCNALRRGDQDIKEIRSTR